MKKIDIFDMHPSGRVMKRSAKLQGNDPLPDITVTVEAGATYLEMAERLRRLAAIFERQQT